MNAAILESRVVDGCIEVRWGDLRFLPWRCTGRIPEFVVSILKWSSGILILKWSSGILILKWSSGMRIL